MHNIGENHKPGVGLTLSGGGGRAIAQLGVISALEEHGIYVNPVKVTEQTSFKLSEKVERVIDMITYTNIQEEIKKCTLYFEPEELKDFPIPQIGDVDNLYKIGYESAKYLLRNTDDDLLEKLQSASPRRLSKLKE